MLNLKRIAILGALSVLFITAGCSTPSVKYGDSKGVETVNTDFGSTDLQTIAEAMTRSLLESRVVLESREPPRVTVYDVRNKTSEYIDTSAITAKIRSQLTRSGRVRFTVSTSEMQNQVDELKRQTQSGLYSAQNQTKMGNMNGAKYRVEGFIGSIVKQTKDVKDVFYNFHLSLINNETGDIEWEDEKEIRKTATR